MAPKISYDDRCLKKWVSDSEFNASIQKVKAAQDSLATGSGPGKDFLGWLDLPKTILSSVVDSVIEKAEELRQNSDIVICVGIGGSYLGAKAAIEFLSPSFDDMRKPRVLFAGHQINSDYLSDLLTLIDDKEVAVNVISKSGTTTEPGIAFRVIRQWMEKKYGRTGAAKRIVATTDPVKGALRKLAKEEGYTTFDIPENVGGRFSVLTPVGLFPIACAGIDVRALVEGAAEAAEFCAAGRIEENPAACYAINRISLLSKENRLKYWRHIRRSHILWANGGSSLRGKVKEKTTRVYFRRAWIIPPTCIL